MARLLILLALAAGLSGCKPAPSAPGTAAGVAPRVLTYASPYPARHPFSQADSEWIAHIAKASNGTVRIQPYWGGSLLSSNENMLEIRHGIADIGMITPMYSRSSHLQRNQPSFYGGVTAIEDQIALYKCLAAAFPAYGADVAGLHILAIQGGGLPGILTRSKPVRTLDDLRGLRLRAQEDTAAVLRGLGVDPVHMSMAEVYPAMAKGVIDGVVAPVDALKAMHLAEVGRYFSTLKIPRGAYPGRAMSARTWASLTPAQQAMFDRSMTVWEQAMTRQITRSGEDGRVYALKEGVAFIDPTPEMQAGFDRLYGANALRLGADLRRFGIDGEPIARHAAQIIAARRPGDPIACEGVPR